MSELHPTAADLRGVPTFADLPDEAVTWLADHMELEQLTGGQLYIAANSPADRMIVILEGALRLEKSEHGPESSLLVARTGAVTGMLPYSRLKTFPLGIRAIEPTRLAVLCTRCFPEMLERFPDLGTRLVALMADRIRDGGRAEAHKEKLAMLGKISASLAHELNNPAAAARRAAESLRESVRSLRQSNVQLDRLALTSEQRAELAEMEQHCLDTSHTHVEFDQLERSDREQEIGSWLDDHGISDAWDLATTLADGGMDNAALESVAGRFPREVLDALFHRVVAALMVGRLVDEIESSTGRISELVKAIKEYSYLDQGSEQEIDVHDGLESTLVMLRHRLKKGILVIREFDRTLPRICAHGSELNQVWTNLIANSAEAMNGEGELRIRTSRDGDGMLVVDVIDNGPGIPPEVQEHLFEPFFTTKPVGDGTGIGLETVQRIVRNHKGSVTFESRPGRTAFSVRLPYSGRKASVPASSQEAGHRDAQ